MIRSMTGFSSTILSLPRKAAESPTSGNSAPEQPLQLAMTLKTLNSRYFECTCKLPYSLSFLETDLIKYFKSQLYRGNVVFMVHLSDPSALTGSIEPSYTAVQGYLTAVDHIKKTFPLSGTLTISDLITLPNIFETKETPLNQETIDRIMKAVEQMTTVLQQMRITEGKALAVDLESRVKVIKKYLEELEPRAHVVMEQKKEQLFATLKTALAETHQESASEAQTTLIYNQLERMDIHEEIVRFKTHLESLLKIIKSDEIETGKKLDFTLQELFREINTIASKCNDSIISALAINTKVELEKSREQAQNIV